MLNFQDIFSKPQFYIDGASAGDVKQGACNDCWLLSAICAVSNKKDLIDRVCVARDEIVGVYGFVFYRDGEWFHTVIDDKLYLHAPDWWEALRDQKDMFSSNNNSRDAERRYRDTLQRGSRALYFAQCRQENETWLPLLEKAYAKAHGDYGALEWGFTGEAVEDLTGGVTTELFVPDILDKERFWNDELRMVNQDFLFSCATGFYDKWQDSEEVRSFPSRSGIVSAHAYSILEAVEKNGEQLLKIRNPCDCERCRWTGAWGDGSAQWTPQWMQELNQKFGDNGTFWMSYDDMLEKFTRIERTRLFDDTWTVKQRWTSVSVPYTAVFQETKFQITLKKDSPMVLVLSQLDRRYFKGMEGDYTFRLHFRLHTEGKEGEDDYIAFSTDKYHLKRSANIDLPNLETGTYSVLMKITASRTWSDPDDVDRTRKIPEKVLREAVKFRPRKLLQVGRAYDFAHAKAKMDGLCEPEAGVSSGRTTQLASRPKERQDTAIPFSEDTANKVSGECDSKEHAVTGATQDKSMDISLREDQKPLAAPEEDGSSAEAPDVNSDNIDGRTTFPEQDPADRMPTPDPIRDTQPPAANDLDKEDCELASDPWNAVCVVGLRVYSKDDQCSVQVIRPGNENAGVVAVRNKRELKRDPIESKE